MRLHLMFEADGRIKGEGIDDIARFEIDGIFDPTISSASWTKAYVGMHRVEYSGLYCGRTICGDWSLAGLTGGFWIWPASTPRGESATEQNEAAVLALEPAGRF